MTGSSLVAQIDVEESKSALARQACTRQCEQTLQVLTWRCAAARRRTLAMMRLPVALDAAQAVEALQIPGEPWGRMGFNKKNILVSCCFLCRLSGCHAHKHTYTVFNRHQCTWMTFHGRVKWTVSRVSFAAASLGMEVQFLATVTIRRVYTRGWRGETLEGGCDASAGADIGSHRTPQPRTHPDNSNLLQRNTFVQNTHTHTQS